VNWLDSLASYDRVLGIVVGGPIDAAKTWTL